MIESYYHTDYYKNTIIIIVVDLTSLKVVILACIAHMQRPRRLFIVVNVYISLVEDD